MALKSAVFPQLGFPARAILGAVLLTDHLDEIRLLATKSDQGTSHPDSDRIAPKGSFMNEFHPGSLEESHLHQPAAKIRISRERLNLAPLALAQLSEFLTS
jgi:hypothetical protein